jgi:hypothetical protein
MAATPVEICNNALTLIGTRRITALTDPSKEARACNDNYDICRKSLLRMHPWNFAMTRVPLTGVAISAIVDNGTGLVKVTTAAVHGLTTGNLASIDGVIGTQEANVDRNAVTVIDTTNFTLDGSTFANAYSSGGIVGLAPAYQYRFKWALPSGFMRVATVSDDQDQQLAHREFKIEGGYILTDQVTVRLEYVANVTTTTLFDPLFDEALAAMVADKIAFKITGSEATQERSARHLKKVMQASRFVDTVENPSEPLDSDEWIRARWSTNQGYVRDPMT